MQSADDFEWEHQNENRQDGENNSLYYGQNNKQKADNVWIELWCVPLPYPYAVWYYN